MGNQQTHFVFLIPMYKYSEMKLANLEAAGRAIRDGSKKVSPITR